METEYKKMYISYEPSPHYKGCKHITGFWKDAAKALEHGTDVDAIKTDLF